MMSDKITPVPNRETMALEHIATLTPEQKTQLLSEMFADKMTTIYQLETKVKRLELENTNLLNHIGNHPEDTTIDSPGYTEFKVWSASVLAIITNMVNWSWSGNAHCKYLDLHIDMRDGAAVMSVKDMAGDRHVINNELLVRQCKNGGYKSIEIPTLEEQGVDCSNLKE